MGKTVPFTPPGKKRNERRAKATGRSPTSGAERLFPIVGIGASAGGLEALDSFLRNVPAASGIAFIIVQHLEPTQKDFMVELLQRATVMKVAQVRERTVVHPDCVYVIPPNKEMSILHGVLHLLERFAPHGLHLPIDFFFRSLANDQRDRSVGVILSGMGSDGTQGLRAIKDKGGGTFVQDPESAKCDGMPRSAIGAGLADIVAPVEALPGKIIAYVQHAPLIAKSALAQADKAHSGLAKILILLRDQTGQDFSLYKNIAVYRRIERRMGVHKIEKIATYVRFLQENPQEVGLLFRELLIGVTGFFRDPDAWEKLKSEVLPALLRDRAPSHVLRAWVIGCATGEEAYSLAIIFKETLDQLKSGQDFSLQIFATDLDGDAIEKARTAVYPHNIVANVSRERLDRFFIPVEHGYQVSKPIRGTVIFAPQNVIMDPPFTRMDLVSCRNLLIYLLPELQKGLLPLFHYSLNPGGVLLLGKSETVGEFTDLFATVDERCRLYRRADSELRSKPVKFPSAFLLAPNASQPTIPSKSTANLQSLADQLLLQKYSPAAVLVNDTGDILYISGRTGKYLEPAAGKVNWNIFAMAREGLRYELKAVFHNALRQREATLFLDSALNVRLFTTGSNKIFKLMKGDLGRPITDIACDLVYSRLADDAREVVRTLVCHEQQLPTRDGHWYSMRILPYRTLEDMIDGVVITFVDITVSKKLEAELRKTQAGLYKQIGEQRLKLERHGRLEMEAGTRPGSEETKAAPSRK